MHAFATRAGALLALGLTAVGCGSPPPLDKQLETLSSWTATMQLARDYDDLVHGRIPNA